MTGRSFNAENTEGCPDGARDSHDPTLLSVCEQSDDRNLGQTLIRLAHLAAAAHRFERFDSVRLEHRSLGTNLDWTSLQPEVHRPRTDALQGQARQLPGAVHTEVNR